MLLFLILQATQSLFGMAMPFGQEHTVGRAQVHALSKVSALASTIRQPDMQEGPEKSTAERSSLLSAAVSVLS